jgi:uncharacterized DUF497 family protein
MEIEFDPDKNEANLQKHGLDLADAELIDFDTSLTVLDGRQDYSGERYLTLGKIGRRLHMLVWSERGGVMRVISLRKANASEIKCYEKTE